MKKIIFILLVLGMATGCMGKISELEMSSTHLFFTNTQSAQRVTSDSSLSLAWLIEGRYESEVIFKNKNGESSIEGNWVNVILVDENTIEIQVDENAGTTTREAFLHIIGKTLNTYAEIEIVQAPEEK